MLDYQKARDLLGIPAFIERRFFKTDAEALQIFFRSARYRCDQSRIKPAADKQADRNVGHQPGGDGTLQQFFELIDILRLGAIADGIILHGNVPVLGSNNSTVTEEQVI